MRNKNRVNMVKREKAVNEMPEKLKTYHYIKNFVSSCIIFVQYGVPRVVFHRRKIPFCVNLFT